MALEQKIDFLLKSLPKVALLEKLQELQHELPNNTTHHQVNGPSRQLFSAIAHCDIPEATDDHLFDSDIKTIERNLDKIDDLIQEIGAQFEKLQWSNSDGDESEVKTFLSTAKTTLAQNQQLIDKCEIFLKNLVTSALRSKLKHNLHRKLSDMDIGQLMHDMENFSKSIDYIDPEVIHLRWGQAQEKISTFRRRALKQEIAVCSLATECRLMHTLKAGLGQLFLQQNELRNDTVQGLKWTVERLNSIDTAVGNSRTHIINVVNGSKKTMAELISSSKQLGQSWSGNKSFVKSSKDQELDALENKLKFNVNLYRKN